jgi:hypothetical protein
MTRLLVISCSFFVNKHNEKGCVMVCSMHSGVTEENHGQSVGMVRVLAVIDWNRILPAQ